MDVWLNPWTFASLLDFRCLWQHLHLCCALCAAAGCWTGAVQRRHEGRSVLADDVEGKFQDAFPGLTQDKDAFLAGLRAPPAVRPSTLGAEVELQGADALPHTCVHHAQLTAATVQLKVCPAAALPAAGARLASCAEMHLLLLPVPRSVSVKSQTARQTLTGRASRSCMRTWSPCCCSTWMAHLPSTQATPRGTC